MHNHLKTLFRSPLKTTVTLLLLAAAAFLFLYNLAEYSAADRDSATLQVLRQTIFRRLKAAVTETII